MDKVLITYYTKTGSTLAVAEYISATLTSAGIEVDLLPFTEVTSLRPYHAVIIGAPINGFKWVPQAEAFLKEYDADLRQKQLATFCLSYLNQYPRPFLRNMIRKNYEKSSEGYSPVKTAVFGGLGGGTFPALIRMAFGVPKEMPKDTRNWDAVNQYSTAIIESLINHH